MATARCDGCQQMVPFVDLRSVLVQGETGYVRLQLCQACRVKAWGSYRVE